MPLLEIRERDSSRPALMRMIGYAFLGVAPVVMVLHYGLGDGGTAMFVLAAIALAPLAFLIGEATENVAEHTGPGIGGFVNASFGNAPELIIALFAVGSGLPNVVRGSITGSVVSTSLLVLGGAMIAGGEGSVDRRSLLLQIGTVLVAALLLLTPSVPGWHGNYQRHDLYVLSLPIAVALVTVYFVITFRNLRVHRNSHSTEPRDGAWSLRTSLATLGLATLVTALVSEILVNSLDTFGRALGLSQFFVAAVIVAFVGNAAEQGGALVIARRGNLRLGAEIAISSSAQVALFVAPVIALLSSVPGDDLPLSFRPVELGAIGLAGIVAALSIADGRAQRWKGVLLVILYCLVVVGFDVAGNR